MTSGIPFSEEEIEYVRIHGPIYKFPSIIAVKLGAKFGKYNGGTRSTKAVSLLMKRLYESSQASDTDLPVTVIEKPAKTPDMRKVRKKKDNN